MASRTQATEIKSHKNDANRSVQAVPSSGTQLPANGESSEILLNLQCVFPQEREEMLVTFVRDEVMRTLRIDPWCPPERHSRLMDLGLDSLMAVQLRNRLTKALQLEQPLPATLMFDHPTIEAIARFLETGALKKKLSPDNIEPNAAAEDLRAVPLRAEEIREMSDEEAEEMLLRRLSHK
jgi:acyl carrier protein